MRQIVIDASVALKWYFPEVYGDECVNLLDQDVEILVPDVLFTQVGTALWRRLKSNDIKPDLAKQILSNLRRLPLVQVESESLLKDAIDIATMTSRTFHEGLYFALAIRHETKLVTADRRWHTLVSTGPMRRYLAFITEVA